jgi:hypothetical protein
MRVATNKPETDIDNPLARLGVGQISDAYTYEVASTEVEKLLTEYISSV